MPNVIKKIVPPAVWKSLSKKDKAECIQIFLKAEIICSCPKRGKMIQKAMRQAALHGNSLGAIAWSGPANPTTGTLSEEGLRAIGYAVSASQQAGFIDLPVTQQGVSPETLGTTAVELSKLVFCFQQYAYTSIDISNGRANYPQIPLNYPEISVDGQGLRRDQIRDYVGVTGALTIPTREFLEYLLNNNFQKVRETAMPLNFIGQLLAYAILYLTQWKNYVIDLIGSRRHDVCPVLSHDQKERLLNERCPASLLSQVQTFMTLRRTRGSQVGYSWNPIAYLTQPNDSSIMNDLYTASGRRVSGAPAIRTSDVQTSSPDYRQGLQTQQDAERRRSSGPRNF